MTNKEIRALTREQLKGNWLKFVLLTLGVILVQYIPNIFLDTDGSIYEIISLILLIFLSVLTTGIYLEFIRKNKFNLSSGIKNFKVYLRYVGIYILMILAIAIVLLILFVLYFAIASGISIQAILYSSNTNIIGASIAGLILITLLAIVIYVIVSLFFVATPYLLVDGFTIGQSLSNSLKLMEGNKWRLFKLELSFIGWFLLSIVTLGIGLLWVVPYYGLTVANFYLKVREEKGI